MNIPNTAQAAAWWRDHGYSVVLAALLLVALALAVALIRAARRGRTDRWVSSLAWFAVLALSTEGMWVVVRERLRLPVLLAVAVCFVAEAALVSSALQANRFYAEHRRPGKHGRAVWVIAAVAGVIVALNAKSVVEFFLRLALPLAAAYLWWNALTADGIEAGTEASSWRWTPRRLLLWVGAIEAGERDAVQINRDRRVAAMVVTAHRLHTGGRWLRARREARLRRLARDADDAMVAEVQDRVQRVFRIRELTAPGGTPDTSPGRPRTASGGLVGHVEAAGNGHRSDALLVGSVTDRPPAAVEKLTPLPSAIGIGQSPTDSGDVREQHLVRPRPTRSADQVADSDDLRERARQAYRDSVAAGLPLAGAELARRFGQSNPRWGTRRIEEVRAAREGAR